MTNNSFYYIKFQDTRCSDVVAQFSLELGDYYSPWNFITVKDGDLLLKINSVHDESHRTVFLHYKSGKIIKIVKQIYKSKKYYAR